MSTFYNLPPPSPNFILKPPARPPYGDMVKENSAKKILKYYNNYLN
jgi:hypothetical protein